MNKYIILQNTWTPYRNSLFNEFQKQGLNFKVLYMSEKESDRNWKISDNIQYEYYIDNGFYKQISYFHLHFNPQIIKYIIKNKNSECILGSSWNDINIIILLILKKIGFLKNIIHIWSEANYLTIGAIKKNNIKHLFRKFILNGIDGQYIIPGKMALITLKKWDINIKKYSLLPNTISEDIFSKNEHKEVISKNMQPTILIVSRLNERIKGIINFLNSLGTDRIKSCKIRIAGDGEDKDLINKYIIDNSYNNNIKLIGFCSYTEIIEEYLNADIFALPSYSDPSPLSVVEAIRLKKPLLLSERCGNHFEALIVGKNGFIFDPTSKTSITNAFDSIMKNRRLWLEMGEISYNLYEKTYNRSKVVSNFIQSIKYK